MKLLYMRILFYLLLAATSPASAKYAKTGCNNTCGNVTIPYPFGIGADCSINKWYIVDCNSSTPYLPALNHLELLRVDLNNQTVIVGTRTPKISDCQSQDQKNSQITSIDLHSTPFLFCSYHNRFVFNGCGNAVMMDNGSVLTGCSTNCLNETVGERNNDCFGISCCQTTIPHYIRSYSINLMGVGGNGGCGYAFLVDDDSYLLGRFSVQSVAANNSSVVPMALMWTLPHSTTLICCRGAADHMNMELDTGNGTSIDSQKCSRHIGYKGNPYLSDGCEVIEDCASCPYSTSCNYDIIYGGDGSSTKVINFTCGPNRSSSLGSKASQSAIGVSVSVGVLFLVAASYALYKWIKKTRERRQRESLATHFMLAMEEERVMSIFDPSLIKEGTRDELLTIANLAMRCLNLNGRYRPTMKEVAIELETIRTSHIPSTKKTNIRPTIYGEDLSFITYSETSSTFAMSKENISQ
ncbi:hypothetical protein QVD17_37391 [Tagetes erecta]|uniref:Wall-associated receptor kinase galacturonan-binding domain-containing protein n=1 Tax=Tagetes erecta TaxID=13708 RepID=A0AAD8NCP1_TARER|nr:hypothetical protein QVD17_37391 [Tagetes erecta]